MSKATERAARLMPGGVPRYVRIYQGEGAPPYCAVFTGKKAEGFYRDMSSNPYHPQSMGLSNSAEHGRIDCGWDRTRGRYVWPPPVGRKNTYCPSLGKRIRFADCPPKVQECIVQDYKTIWSL